MRITFSKVHKHYKANIWYIEVVGEDGSTINGEALSLDDAEKCRLRFENMMQERLTRRGYVRANNV